MKIYAKHKIVWNSILCVMLMLVMTLALQTTVYGASASVAISSSNVTQGEQFDVIISIKADANIGAYNFYIDYDANVIEAVSGFEGGGNGRIQLMSYAQSTNVSNEATIKVTFKAKNPGKSSLKYISISEDNGVIDFDSADNMSVTATEGSVTVKAPYVASTNNYLSSLKVEAVKADGSTYSLDLSPKFSKDVTKYSAEAVEGVTKLVVSATQEDAKASIKTSGTAMDPGENTTTITVTAEDGSTRKYVIYTNVAKPPETTTPPPEPIIVQIDGTDSYIEDINDAVALPEGFETFEYNYKDKTVVAAKGLVKNLIVMYVTKGDGSAGQLYIYEEDTDTFYPMSNIQITQKLYTIVKEPDDLVIPEGFVETNVSVGESTFKGWANSDVENIYLIYAMNWNGDKGLYYYDANESQIIRYFDIAVQAGVAVDDYNSLLSENDKLKDEINQLKADNNKEESSSIKLYKNLALVCCIMAVIYLGIIIYLVVNKRKNDDEVDEADSEKAEMEVAEVEESESKEDKAETEEAKSVEIAEATDEMDVAVEAIVADIAEEIAEDVAEVQDADVVEEITEEVVEENETEEVITTAEEISTEKTDEEVVVEEEIAEKEAVEEETVVAMPPEEFAGFDDEQDEIDDMLLDFEDIITSDVEAAIEEENEVSDSEIEVENVEFAEEIEPDTEVIELVQHEEEIQVEDEIFAEANVEEPIADEVTEEESIIEKSMIEESIIEEAVIGELVTEDSVTEDSVTEDSVTEDSVTEDSVTEDSVVEDSVIEETVTEETVTQEPVAEASTVDFTAEDKKKKVAEIMEDKNSSISADDLDMVIDELFDDLFG